MQKYTAPDCFYEESVPQAIIAASTDDYPADFIDPEFS